MENSDPIVAMMVPLNCKENKTNPSFTPNRPIRILEKMKNIFETI